MLKIVDSELPGLLGLCLDDMPFQESVLVAARANPHGSWGASLLWAVHEMASELVVAATGRPEPRQVQAYACIQQFESTLREPGVQAQLLLETLFPHSSEPVASPSVRGKSKANYSVERLMQRLVEETSRPFAYAPMLHYLRRQLHANVGDATGKATEELWLDIGERLGAIGGIEALFLRKELSVGKFERDDLPFWTGDINMSEPEPELELEQGVVERHAAAERERAEAQLRETERAEQVCDMALLFIYM
jgi:hypothetical protein